jgi:hypothetical protein
VSSPWSKGSKNTKKKVSKKKAAKRKAKKVEEKAEEVRKGETDITAPISENIDEELDINIEGIDTEDFDAIMKAMGFEKMKDAAKRMKLHIAVHGLPKVGKTRFCLSAAEYEGETLKSDDGREVIIPAGYPVVVIDTEDGSRQLSSQVPVEWQEKIYIKNVYREDPNTFECDPLLSLREVDKILSSLRFMKQGTIIIDNFPDVVSWMNGVLRKKVLNIRPADGVQPSDYFWRNDKMYGFVRKLFFTKNVHVIFTGQDEEVYRDASITPTGIYKPNWYKKVPYWVDFVVHAKKSQTRDGLMRWIEITDSRFDLPEDLPRPIKIMDSTFSNFVKKFTPVICKGQKNVKNVKKPKKKDKK